MAVIEKKEVEITKFHGSGSLWTYELVDMWGNIFKGEFHGNRNELEESLAKVATTIDKVQNKKYGVKDIRRKVSGLSSV